jgi:hypothetical protein
MDKNDPGANAVDAEKPVGTKPFHKRPGYSTSGDSVTQPVKPAPKSPEPGA